MTTNRSNEERKRVLGAVEASLGKQRRGGFEHVLSMPSDGLTAVSNGVFDLGSQRVAFRQRFLIVDDDEESSEGSFVSHWVETFFDCDRLYICDAASEVGEDDQWTVVDYAGVQASPLNIGYWLRGVQKVLTVEISARFRGGAVLECDVLLAAAIQRAPEKEAPGIRMSIGEAELATDVPIRMLVTIDADGYLRVVETVLLANAARGPVDLRLELFKSPQMITLEPPANATPQEVGNFIHELIAAGEASA